MSSWYCIYGFRLKRICTFNSQKPSPYCEHSTNLILYAVISLYHGALLFPKAIKNIICQMFALILGPSHIHSATAGNTHHYMCTRKQLKKVTDIKCTLTHAWVAVKLKTTVPISFEKWKNPKNKMKLNICICICIFYRNQRSWSWVPETNQYCETYALFVLAF